MTRNYTVRVPYAANYATAIAINLNDMSTGMLSIFNEFRYYSVRAVKLTLTPLNSRCIGNRIATTDGSTDGTTDVSLPLFILYSKTEQTINQPTLINDPRSKSYSYGRTISIYQKVSTPIVVGGQGSSANVDLFNKKSPWLSTSDYNFVHGRFHAATPNWSDVVSEVPQDLSYNVHLRVYVCFKHHIS